MEKIREYLKYNGKTGKFIWIKKISDKTVVGNFAGSTRKDGYVTIRFNKKSYLAHRLAWFFKYDKWPSKNLDHKNGNTSDNRIQNLREATVRENAINLAVHRKGKLPGSKKAKRKWSSYMEIFNKKVYLGNFHSEKEASEQYYKGSKYVNLYQCCPETFRKLLKTLD